MDNLEFLEIVHGQFAHCVDVLEAKRAKYEVDNDRLAAFKELPESPLMVWRGLALEHSQRLSDMIRDGIDKHSKGEWRKVITHHLNWLFILSTLVKELSDEE